MNSRFFEIYDQLTEKEIRKFSKFLQSPYFNRKKELSIILAFLRKNKKRDVSLIFAKMFPGEVFDAKKMTHFNSYFLQALEEYLAIDKMREVPSAKYRYLMTVFAERNLSRSFTIAKRNALRDLEKSNQRNANYFNHQYFIKEEEFKQLRESGRTTEYNLQALSDSGDIVFMAQKLKNACSMLSHRSVLNKEYDFGLLTAVINKIEKSKNLLEIPALSIYYYAYIALSNQEREDAFFKLRGEMTRQLHFFSQFEIRDIYILSINYCIKRLNKGDEGYFLTVFDIYKEGLDKEAFIEHGILSRFTYNNIVGAALKLKKFEWCEQFIHQYREYLDSDTRSDTYHFNWAKYLFQKGDYDKAMPLLLQTRFDDVLHQNRARLMLTKMYYELDEWDVLENYLDSWDKFLKRKVEIGYHRENYSNIINVFKKLILLNTFSKTKISALIEEIEQLNVLTEKNWFLDKLKQF